MTAQLFPGRAARRSPSTLVAFVLSCFTRGESGPAALFDDLYDSAAARLDNHRHIVHDRVPVARPHMILAGHRVEPHALLRQHCADLHLAAIPERGAVFTYDV